MSTNPDAMRGCDDQCDPATDRRFVFDILSLQRARLYKVWSDTIVAARTRIRRGDLNKGFINNIWFSIQNQC